MFRAMIYLTDKLIHTGFNLLFVAFFIYFITLNNSAMGIQRSFNEIFAVVRM